MATGDEHQLERCEGRGPRRAPEDVVDLLVAVADVDHDRDVETLSCLVDWVEVGLGHDAVGLNRTHEHAAGAVRHGPFELLDGLVDRQERQRRGPPEALRAALGHIGEPAVVAAAERDLHLRPSRRGAYEERRVQHLDVHPHVVHVPESGVDIRHLRRFLGRRDRPAGGALPFLHLSRRPGRRAETPRLAVDDPAGPPSRLSRLREGRTEPDVRSVHVLPRTLRLDDVGVGVDGRERYRVPHLGSFRLLNHGLHSPSLSPGTLYQWVSMRLQRTRHVITHGLTRLGFAPSPPCGNLCPLACVGRALTPERARMDRNGVGRALVDRVGLRVGAETAHPGCAI